MHGKTHHYEWHCSIYTICLFPSIHRARPEIDAFLRLSLRRPWTVQSSDLWDKPGRVASVQEGAQLNLHGQRKTVVLYVLPFQFYYIWHGTVWLTHGWIMEERMYVGGATSSVPSTESIQRLPWCKPFVHVTCIPSISLQTASWQYWQQNHIRGKNNIPFV